MTRHLTLLRVLLAAAITSTAIHYTHNFVEASSYPTLPPINSAMGFQVGIVLSWPLLTGIGLWGYRRYVAGETRRAGWAFVVYSVLGISTIGHFLGPPPDIPPFFFATIFTDFLTGTAMLAFGIAALRSARSKD